MSNYENAQYIYNEKKDRYVLEGVKKCKKYIYTFNELEDGDFAKNGWYPKGNAVYEVFYDEDITQDFTRVY